MRFTHTVSALILLLSLIVTGSTCRSGERKETPKSLPAVELLAEDIDVTEAAIRDLENRVKLDPEDMIAYNMLAERYLQRLRETGNMSYLVLATQAVQASLKVLPVDHNVDGLRLQAEVEFALHDFQAALKHGMQLAELVPDNAYPYQLIIDALIELGDYDKADSFLRKMIKRNDSSPNSRLIIEIRTARLETLKGNNEKAQKHLLNALAQAPKISRGKRELVAWCRWQLGELAFSQGDYNGAEQYYNESLITFPNYFRTLASLGRLKSARGDLNGGIEIYEKIVKIIPDPVFMAMLGDLYKLAGREKEASAQYDLVEQIGKLSELNGVLYNRNLALFYADHDMKAAKAYEMAVKEYEVRRDIYGADAVAWAALKAGKLTEAQAAIKEALRLGTKDALLYYHAGMIARAAGDTTAMQNYLKLALKFNANLNPLQALNAKKALAADGNRG